MDSFPTFSNFDWMITGSWLRYTYLSYFMCALFVRHGWWDDIWWYWETSSANFAIHAITTSSEAGTNSFRWLSSSSSCVTSIELIADGEMQNFMPTKGAPFRIRVHWISLSLVCTCLQNTVTLSHYVSKDVNRDCFVWFSSWYDDVPPANSIWSSFFVKHGFSFFNNWLD